MPTDLVAPPDVSALPSARTPVTLTPDGVPDSPPTASLGPLRLPPSIYTRPQDIPNKQPWYALTKSQQAVPESPDYNPNGPSSYGQAMRGVDTGAPGSAAPMTKLGKLLYILKGVGTGAAAGAGTTNFGAGFENATEADMRQKQFEQQQQQAQIGMQQARQNLAFMPLMRAAQIEQMRQNTQTKESQEELNRSKAQRWGKPYQVGTRMMATNPDTGQLEDVGAAKPGKPTVHEMGDRTYQYDEGTGAWKDVGPAKAGSQTPYGKIPAEIYGMLGAMPTTSTWEGKDYGSVQGAMNAWGREAMAIKDNEAKSRAAGYATTRGQVVTNTQTGVTAPVSWDKLSTAPPGLYVSPQYDPNTRLAMGAWTDLKPGGKTGTQVTSYNTFLQHAGNLYDAVESLHNSGYPDWNKSINWLRNHSGDPRVQEFLTKLDPVQKEFQSFLLNNRALYSEDRETAQKMMSENSSPAQMYGVLRTMVHTGGARLQETNNSFKRATGTDIPDLISPEAQSSMDKIAGAGAPVLPRVPRGGRIGSPAPAASAAPTPGTHVFDSKAWKVANPKGDVNAAIAEAKRQGYKVIQ